MYEDSRGLIWIATREGLNIYNPKIDELTILAEKNGLSNLLTVGIVEDDNSNMWITSAKGLTHIIPGCLTQRPVCMIFVVIFMMKEMVYRVAVLINAL